jgi:uncharacterized protein (DUF1697 family)
MATHIALLRGINVGGNRKVPMADLRQLCEKAGLAKVETYIQSGNVVFTSKSAARALEAKLEGAIESQFGFKVDVLVRTKADWAIYAAGNPLLEASAVSPNHVMMLLSKLPPKTDAVATLRPRAMAGERIEAAGQALWIHYPAGAGTTKLTPALLDRALGSPVTARNWRTVQELLRMLG